MVIQVMAEEIGAEKLVVDDTRNVMLSSLADQVKDPMYMKNGGARQVVGAVASLLTATDAVVSDQGEGRAGGGQEKGGRRVGEGWGKTDGQERRHERGDVIQRALVCVH